MKMIQHELLNMKAMYHLDSIVFPKNYNRVRKIANIQTLIKEAVQAGPAEGGGFQMWRTFLMVFDLFVFVKALEDEQMIKKHRKGFKKQGQLVREGSFPRIVDKILEVLEQQLVSQEDLATIACDGNLKRLCSTCNKNITVKGIISRTMLPACDKIILGMPTVLIRPGADNLFSCGARACNCSLDQTIEFLSWFTAVYASIDQLLYTRCDYCFLLAPVKEVLGIYFTQQKNVEVLLLQNY